MNYFPNLPDDAHAAHLFARYPHIYKLYSMASSGIMRGPSPLSFQLRETIGAFTSALNDCGFCFGAHVRTAQLFGLPDDLLELLIEDIDTAPIADKEKPLFHYARKLTLEPSRMVNQDADAIFEAGWDEDALHSVIAVVCTFNFMNRLASGMGIEVERLDLDQLGRERFNNEWRPMVPIAAEMVADSPEEAYAAAPPDWNEILNLNTSE